jgi:hypothetical protein
MTRLICLLAMLVLLHSPLTFGDESASGIVESSSDTSSSTGELLEKGAKDRKKSAKKKSTKDWSKIKEEDLDKEWEGGDENEELEVC